MEELGTTPFWALLFAVAGVVILRAVLLVGGGTLFLRTRLAQRRRVYRHGFARDQLRKELTAAVPVLLLDVAAFALVRTLGGIPFAAPTPARVAFTFVVLFVWFEVWFYVLHRTLHHPRLYFLHARHHVARVTHPLTSLSFDLVERALLIGGLLGFTALASHVLPLALPGLAAYLFVNLALNVLAHLNVELFPAGYGRSWLSRVFISTTFHAMHHARFQNHYGLFTTVLDRLFSTTWEDYPEVHARAASGEGLSRLGERIARERLDRPLASDAVEAAK